MLVCRVLLLDEVLLDLESELPLWDAARFFRVATPDVVQHQVLYLPGHHLRMLSALDCRCDGDDEKLLGVKTAEEQCWRMSMRTAATT